MTCELRFVRFGRRVELQGKLARRRVDPEHLRLLRRLNGRHRAEAIGPMTIRSKCASREDLRRPHFRDELLRGEVAKEDAVRREATTVRRRRRTQKGGRARPRSAHAHRSCCSKFFAERSWRLASSKYV